MSNSRLLKQGQVVSMQETLTIAKTKLARTKPSTGPRVGHKDGGSGMAGMARAIPTKYWYGPARPI